jgi:hypothetical protein
MSLRVRLLSLAAALGFASAAVYSSSAQNPTIKTAMRTKLLNAQPLLEAVVTEDFVAIGRSADALNRISETEIVSWQANPQPEYRRQAMSFVLAVQGLREAAAKRDIDTALTEYTELVSSCTRCHAHVRRSRVVSVEGVPFRGVGRES